jgi:hypothetical protein
MKNTNDKECTRVRKLWRKICNPQKARSAMWNSRANIKKLFPEQKYNIEFAFEVAGKQFYQFRDLFSIPFERGLMAIAIYEQARCKCSFEYLKLHCEAMTKVLRPDDGKIDVFKINELNEQMKVRLQLAIDVDLLYKLASVVFFADTENPCIYEPQVCVDKIKFWQAHKGVADFFLQKPLTELMPFLKNSGLDLGTFSEVSKTLNEIHLERLKTLDFKK